MERFTLLPKSNPKSKFKILQITFYKAETKQAIFKKYGTQVFEKDRLSDRGKLRKLKIFYENPAKQPTSKSESKSVVFFPVFLERLGVLDL